MDLYAWLVSGSGSVGSASLPSSSREPPEFLKIQKTKPPRRPQSPEGGTTGLAASETLTPLESKLKDIIVSVYSDKKKARSLPETQHRTSCTADTAASVGSVSPPLVSIAGVYSDRRKKVDREGKDPQVSSHLDTANSLHDSQRLLEDSARCNSQFESLALGESKRRLQALTRPHPDGSESSTVRSRVTSEPDFGFGKVTQSASAAARRSPEGQVGVDLPTDLVGPNTEDTRDLPQSSHSSSGYANRKDLNSRMSDTRSVASTGNLSSSAPIFSADDQNIELVDPDFTHVSQLGSLPYSNAKQGTYLRHDQLLGVAPVIPGADRSHPVSLDFLNSSPSLLYSFTDPTSTSEGRSPPGIGKEPHSGITDSFGVTPNLYQPQQVKTRQLRKGHSTKGYPVENADSAARSPPVYVPELRTPLPRAQGGSRDVTPTPESTMDVDLTEKGEPSAGVMSSQAHTSLSTLPSQDTPQATMPLSDEPASTGSDSERLPGMKSLDSDIETASVVSVQQLTEAYLNEPPVDFPTTPLSEGGKIPFTFPAESPSLARTLSYELPKLSPSPQVGAREPLRVQRLPTPSQCRTLSSEPPRQAAARDPDTSRSMLSEQDELPIPGKVPAHINQSASKRPILSPFSDGGVPKSLGQTAVAAKAAQEEDTDFTVLERRLEAEMRSRIFLEGQLEAVKEECDVALEERPKLVSSLSRAKAELAEMAAALEEERNKHRSLVPETSSNDAKKVLEKLRDTEQALAQEKRALADLQTRLGEEKQNSHRLEKNLEDTAQSLKNQELDTAKLREKLQQSHTEMTEKADKFEEMACRLSSLGASYDALEQNKSWLHDQLQEAQRAKLKLQGELRESKASGIAHSIKCDQLEKENVAHQEQIADLLQGVLQDKASMVSKLETIKEDVLSHEDLYAKLIAEKAQLEDTVRRKDEALAQLGSEVARAQVGREELEQKLGEANLANEELASRNDEVGRDNKHLTHKLDTSLRDLEEKDSDWKEVEKIKSSLQEKLRNTDAELAGKEGTIHSLKEANDLLQQELAMVNDAKGSLERELADSRRELAVLEADLKSALERCRDGDSRLRGVLESQLSTDDQKQALLALLEEKDQELDQKERAVKLMESQMNELLKEFGSLQDNFKSIASESGSVTNSIAEKDRVISHLSSEKDVRDEELHSLSRENTDLHETLAQLQHEKAHLLGHVEGSVDQGDYKRALQEKAELQEELNSLKVDQKRDEIKSRAKVNRLETDLRAAQKAASKAQRELEGFRDEIDKELNQSIEAKRKVEADLKVANERLQGALDDKEKAESVLSSLKPSEHKMEEVLKAKCERLEEQNADLTEQLQELAQQKVDVERASGLVAAKLKQNADKERRKLAEKNRDISLEVERLKGRLAGMHGTQITVRDHATSLEEALAKKESLIVKLSAEAQKLLEDKSMDSEAFRTQIGTLQEQLTELKADLALQREHAENERRRADELEAEVQKHRSSKQADQSIMDPAVEVSRLSDQLTALSSEKEVLQSDVSYLKSQLLISKTSADSAKRQIADKASQVEILERELRISESRCEQAEEEVRQLQEHMKAGKGTERGATGARMERDLSGSADESTDHPGSQSGIGSDIEARPDSDAEKMAKLNDTLRELGSRVVQARLQGQEAAELKKSGEISVLQKELGSKSKTLNTLQSYLHSLKDDMNKLHSQMDHHSASMKESYKSSRLIESQIEDLRRNSSLPSPFMLATPTEQSQ